MPSGRLVFDLGLMVCVFTILVSRAGAQTKVATGERCTEPYYRQCQHQDDVCLDSMCARKAGQNCSDALTSCVAGATCSSDVCSCASPLTTKGGLCLGTYRKVGGACNPAEGTTACYDRAANCEIIRGASGVAGVCVCMRGYTKTKDETCLIQPAPTNGACAFGYLCKPGDTCFNGYCKTKAGEACTNGYDCVPNSYCDYEKVGSICTCTTPYNNESGLCAAPPGLVYGRCNPTEQGSCQDVSAKCVGYMNKGMCLCKESYITTVALGCMAQFRALHGSCNLNEPSACDDVNAECLETGQGARCSCKADYAQTMDDRCLAKDTVGAFKRPCGVRSFCKSDADRCSDHVCKRAAGSSCSMAASGECVSGATCEANGCTCMEGLRAVGGYCYRIQKSVGGTCVKSDGNQACDDDLAECVVSGTSGVGVCECSGTASTDGTCSTAVLTKASLLVLALTALTSLIAF